MSTIWEEFAKSIKEYQEIPLPDGPHWTPHGGKFWAKDGKYYWPDGDITTSQPIALWDNPSTINSVEDYSAWSDEHRAAVWAETQRKLEKYEKQAQQYLENREKLVESARAKLTPEEFDAVFESGQDG